MEEVARAEENSIRRLLTPAQPASLAFREFDFTSLKENFVKSSK